MRTYKDWKEQLNLAQTSRKSDLPSEKSDSVQEETGWPSKQSEEAKLFTLQPLDTKDQGDDVEHKILMDISKSEQDSSSKQYRADLDDEMDPESEKIKADTGKELDGATKDDSADAQTRNRQPIEHSMEYIESSSDEDDYDDCKAQQQHNITQVLVFPVVICSKESSEGGRLCEDPPVDAASDDKGSQNRSGSSGSHDQGSGSPPSGAAGGGTPPGAFQSWNFAMSGSGDGGDGGDGDRPRQEPKPLPDDAVDIAKAAVRPKDDVQVSLSERNQTLPVSVDPDLLMEEETSLGEQAADAALTDPALRGTASSVTIMVTGLDGHHDQLQTWQHCGSANNNADVESGPLLGPNEDPEAAGADDSPSSSLQKPVGECSGSTLSSTPVKRDVPPLEDPLHGSSIEGDIQESAEYILQSNDPPGTQVHADFSESGGQAKPVGMSRSQSNVSGDSGVASFSCLTTGTSCSSLQAPESPESEGYQSDQKSPVDEQPKTQSNLVRMPDDDVKPGAVTEALAINQHDLNIKDPEASGTDQKGEAFCAAPVQERVLEDGSHCRMDGSSKTLSDQFAESLSLEGPLNKDLPTPKSFMDLTFDSITGERSLMPQSEGQGASTNTNMAGAQIDAPEIFANVHETGDESGINKGNITSTVTAQISKLEVDIPFRSLSSLSGPSTRPVGNVAGEGVIAQEQGGGHGPATDGPGTPVGGPRSTSEGHLGARPKVHEQPNQDPGTAPGGFPNVHNTRSGTASGHRRAGRDPWRSPETPSRETGNQRTILVSAADRSHDIAGADPEEVNYCLLLQLLDMMRSVMSRIRPNHRYGHAFGHILERMRGSLVITDGHYDPGEQWMDLASLGRGGQGVCMLCTDLNSDFKFAMKKIYWKDFREEEVTLMSRVMNHVGTLQLYGLIYFNDHFYLIMEYLAGPTLRELITSRYDNHQPLSLYEALHILQQLLSTLSHLWRHRVLHDDIKAENVVLRNSLDGRVLHIVCVIDYGLAKLGEVPPLESPEGTAPYMSPEKAASKGHGHKADVFAVMIAFIFMLQSFVPREKLGHWAVVYQMAEKGPVMDYIYLDLPEVIFDLIARGFHWDPDSRASSEELENHPAFNLLDRSPNDAIFHQHIRPQDVLTVRTSETDQRAVPDFTHPMPDFPHPAPDFPHPMPDDIPSDTQSDASDLTGMDVVNSQRIPNIAVDMSSIRPETRAPPPDSPTHPVNQVGVQCMEEDSDDITSRYSDIQRPFMRHLPVWDGQVPTQVTTGRQFDRYTSRGLHVLVMAEHDRHPMIPSVVEEYLDLHPENEASDMEEEEERT